MSSSRCKYDLVSFGRIEMLLNLDPGLLIFIGRFLRQGVNTSMNVGVIIRIVIYDRIHYLHRCLGSGCIVEINQRIAIHLAFKNWKILTNLLNIERSYLSLLTHPFLVL